MAFLLTLALRLGMTLQDLRERLSAEELFLWRAYDQQSPIGDTRGDVQAAIVAAAAFQAQGARVAVGDMIPRWIEANEGQAETYQHGDGEHALKDFLIRVS